MISGHASTCGLKIIYDLNPRPETCWMRALVKKNEMAIIAILCVQWNKVQDGWINLDQPVEKLIHKIAIEIIWFLMFTLVI